MNEILKVAVAGCGSRGQDTYGNIMAGMRDKVQVVAAADPRPERLQAMKETWGLRDDQCFATAEEMTAQPKLADAMVIATPDNCHYLQAKAAMEKGYHLLLEKPISPTAEQCQDLARIANEKGLKVVICHVLRYTVFYQKIKEIMDSGLLGNIISIQAIEQVCYWHQAHSFVRGNWRNSKESSPMILAKCCHDMDILLWLTGKHCTGVSSMGSLSHFKAENAPEGAPARCTDGCPAGDKCPYNAVTFYMSELERGNTDWPCNILSVHPTKETITEALKTGPYGRCVYHCDNDVVDHQVVNMTMGGGSTISFTMSAFTAHGGRCIRVMGTHGEIVADSKKNTITVMPYGGKDEVIDVTTLASDFSGHGGGDKILIKEFIEYLMHDVSTPTLTSINDSVESHLVALGAEESRLYQGNTVFF